MSSLVKPTNNILFGIFLFFIGFPIEKQEIKSFDFISEIKFTEEIKGTSLNLCMELFVVNFEKEGTVRIANEKREGEIFIPLSDGSIGNGTQFDVEGNRGTTFGAGPRPNGKKMCVNKSVRRTTCPDHILKNGILANEYKLISFGDFGPDGIRYGKESLITLWPDGKKWKGIPLKGKSHPMLSLAERIGKPIA